MRAAARIVGKPIDLRIRKIRRGGGDPRRSPVCAHRDHPGAVALELREHDAFSSIVVANADARSIDQGNVIFHRLVAWNRGTRMVVVGFSQPQGIVGSAHHDAQVREAIPSNRGIPHRSLDCRPGRFFRRKLRIRRWVKRLAPRAERVQEALALLAAWIAHRCARRLHFPIQGGVRGTGSMRKSKMARCPRPAFHVRLKKKSNYYTLLYNPIFMV